MSANRQDPSQARVFTSGEQAEIAAASEARTPKPASSWASTPSALRHRPASTLTLPRSVWAYLRSIGPGQASRYIEALIRADAAAQGRPIPDEDEQGGRTW